MQVKVSRQRVNNWDCRNTISCTEEQIPCWGGGQTGRSSPSPPVGLAQCNHTLVVRAKSFPPISCPTAYYRGNILGSIILFRNIQNLQATLMIFICCASSKKENTLKGGREWTPNTKWSEVSTVIGNWPFFIQQIRKWSLNTKLQWRSALVRASAASNQSSLCSRSGHTPRSFPPPVCSSAHGRCSWWQSWYHGSENVFTQDPCFLVQVSFVLSRSPGCNEGSTDSHNPASSIWQSDWDRQSSPEQCVSDLSNFIAKRNVKCHWPWYNSRTAP